MSKNMQFSFRVGTFLFFCLLMIVPEVFARAGGGGSGRGGVAAVILYPFILIYSAIISYVAYLKDQKCRALAHDLSRKDPIWDADAIRRRIELIFMKVQDAWMERDQSIAKEVMSQRLFDNHKRQTDRMLEKKEKNILENIVLNECRLVQVMDYKDDSRDKLTVLIKAAMVDYTIDEVTQKIISGDKEKKPFKEIWKFVRSEHGWVLDEIDSDVHLDDVATGAVFSEA